MLPILFILVYLIEFFGKNHQFFVAEPLRLPVFLLHVTMVHLAPIANAHIFRRGQTSCLSARQRCAKGASIDCFFSFRGRTNPGVAARRECGFVIDCNSVFYKGIIKGKLLHCKSLPFGVRKLTFCNAKAHLL
ncbi:hypothetical protein FIN92_07780 [Prevotella brunnea]|uniref:hypothetical protein n=1 Tax=Prevotella brunnea TaxID=2508867 RepID=UPI002819357E|nr:hypothetical protein [Prevotella brunnea]MDR0186471.1 hypothetical protein [Prevotella brunnea]